MSDPQHRAKNLARRALPTPVFTDLATAYHTHIQSRYQPEFEYCLNSNGLVALYHNKVGVGAFCVGVTEDVPVWDALLTLYWAIKFNEVYFLQTANYASWTFSHFDVIPLYAAANADGHRTPWAPNWPRPHDFPLRESPLDTPVPRNPPPLRDESPRDVVVGLFIVFGWIILWIILLAALAFYLAKLIHG